jgi:hypothetical protein
VQLVRDESIKPMPKGGECISRLSKKKCFAMKAASQREGLRPREERLTDVHREQRSADSGREKNDFVFVFVY